MQIRSYQPDDEAAVIALWNRAGLTRSWNDPRQDILRKLTVQREWFLIGTADKCVVATVMVGYDGHRGWVNYLAVDPEYRRRGFGRQMMNHAERVLAEAECPKLNLQVRSANEGALRFYQQLGYQLDQVVSLGKRLIIDS